MLGLSGKSYGQQCDLVYGTAIGYIPCATGQGTNTGSYQMFIVNPGCSCPGPPWTYEVWYSTGLGSNTTVGSGPIFSSPSNPSNPFSGPQWTLPAGNYVAMITNANGICAASNSNGNSSSIFAFSLTNPTPIQATVTSSTLACFNSTNGTITVAPSGGNTTMGSISYLVSLYNGTNLIGTPITISSGNTGAFTGLPSGNYQVKIKVVYNSTTFCETTYGTIINAPPAINITHTKTNLGCNGLNNGSINITASGGTPGYTYSWTGPNSFTIRGKRVFN